MQGMRDSMVWMEMGEVKRRYRFPLPLMTGVTIQLNHSAYNGWHEGVIEFCLRLSSVDPFAEDCIDDTVYHTPYPHVVLKQAGHHHVYSHDAFRKAVVLIYASSLRPQFEAFGIDFRLPIWPIAITPRIKDIIDQIKHRLPVARMPGVADELDTLAWLLLQHLYAQRKDLLKVDTPFDEGVMVIAEHMQRHFGDSLDIVELARRHGMSRRTFFRSWGRVFSKTPSAYLTDIRMGQAAIMLRRTSMRIAEIAERTGYGSCGYFSSVFRNRHGLSPLAFRHQWLASLPPEASR